MDEAQARDAIESLRQRLPLPHEASAWFFDPQFQRAAVKVLPGEYFVDGGDFAVTTTLGSCVSVCLHDAGTGVGGMNHFMLPDEGPHADEPRYGPFAMRLLVSGMLARGARAGAMTAKVFGGGQVMQSLAGTLIGEKNVAFALQFLARERIPVVAQDVLGPHPRKLCQFPRSGEVLCRHLPISSMEFLP